MQREAFLVCFDRQRRVALTSSAPAAVADSATLPMVRRREQESYEQAMRRIAVGRISVTDLRLGSLVGRVEAPSLAEDGIRFRREARIFLAHLDRGALLLERGSCDDPVLWVPHTEVAQAVSTLRIPELNLFIEGYVSGWIPDGWITLGA